MTIAHYDVAPLIRAAVPNLLTKVSAPTRLPEVYAFMNDFSNHAKHAIEVHDLAAAKKDFLLADKLFRQGDRIVQMLIENVFVFRFSSFLQRNGHEQTLVKAIIPKRLYALYLKQVMQSGC